ncbi:MAG: hypothetical protein JW860_13045 [Sedimentisphaerales bacterium]|nr:hypothetical protein [Sedimentisphaerales bacterium]
MESFKTIEEYLEYVGRFRKSKYGRQFRNQFRDTRGTAELAMLAAPSEDEFDDFRRTVKVMTEIEKTEPEKLNDENIRDIAERARADSGNVSIFINGFVLNRKSK